MYLQCKGRVQEDIMYHNMTNTFLLLSGRGTVRSHISIIDGREFACLGYCSNTVLFKDRQGKNFLPKLSGWQEITGPLFNLIQSHVESRTDDATLVQTTVQVDNNLASSMVVYDLKLPYVAYMWREESHPN